MSTTTSTTTASKRSTSIVVAAATATALVAVSAAVAYYFKRKCKNNTATTTTTASSAQPQLVGHVTEVNVYPIKSCQGITYTQVDMWKSGLRYDRHWMLVNAETNRFITQREYPTMALIGVNLLADALQVTVPTNNANGDQPATQSIMIPFDYNHGERRSVTVWKSTCTAIDQGDQVAEFFSQYLQAPVRLVKMTDSSEYVRLVSEKNRPLPDSQTHFADGYPCLVANTASLQDVNDKMNGPSKGTITMKRFRPNIVVDTNQPWIEDTWKEIKIGDLTMHTVKACQRCVLTTVTADGKFSDDGEPLATVTRIHADATGNAVFGTNACPIYDSSSSSQTVGAVRVGAPVYVLRSSQ